MEQELRLAMFIFTTALLAAVTPPRETPFAAWSHALEQSSSVLEPNDVALEATSPRPAMPSTILAIATATPTATPSTTPTPTATPTLPPISGVTLAPGGMVLNGPTPTPQSTIFPRKIIFVAIQGQDFTNIGALDPRVSYAFQSFDTIFAKYQITSYSYASFDSKGDDAQIYCSRFRAAPILIIDTFIAQSPSVNKFTSGISYKVHLHGQQYTCDGTSLSPIGGPVFEGDWQHIYYPNPISGVYTGLAFLTSPWINKYKVWLTIPATFLGSFEHDQDADNGTIYCAVADGMAKFLRASWVSNDALVLPNPLPTGAPPFGGISPAPAISPSALGASPAPSAPPVPPDNLTCSGK